MTQPSQSPKEAASPARESERHIRSISYWFVSFALALIGHYFMGFSDNETLAYGASVFALLNLLNYSAMFGRPKAKSGGPSAKKGPDEGSSSQRNSPRNH